jgi:hypothetical protein
MSRYFIHKSEFEDKTNERSVTGMRLRTTSSVLPHIMVALVTQE